MRGFERAARLDADARRLAPVHATLALEVLPVERLAFEAAPSRRRVDRRSRPRSRGAGRGSGVEAARWPGLRAEARLQLRARQRSLGSTLSATTPAEIDVVRLVDDAHGAASDLAQDAVARAGEEGLVARRPAAGSARARQSRLRLGACAPSRSGARARRANARAPPGRGVPSPWRRARARCARRSARLGAFFSSANELGRGLARRSRSAPRCAARSAGDDRVQLDRRPSTSSATGGGLRCPAADRGHVLRGFSGEEAAARRRAPRG